jgi:alkylation response protein AidB-like acyl-CoA dehydrogenase
MAVPWEAVEAVADEGAARAAEIEDASRLPVDLVERLHAGGFFRMPLPAEDGGWGATPAECFRASARIAAGDGSLGWMVAAAAFFNGILAAAAPRTFTDAFFADRRSLLAGSAAGTGTARAVADGYEVEGSWTFSSGCWDANWFCGFCLEGLAGGEPVLRLAMVPAARGEVHPSWDVVGLRGTSSDTVTFPRQVVPADWTFVYPVPVGQPLPADGPVAAYGRGLWPTATAAAATQLGIARRALDEIVPFARGKRRRGTAGPLIEEQAFHRELFAAEAAWLTAHDAMGHELDRLWGRAVDGEEIDLETRRRARLVATHAAQTGAQIVRACFDLGGATVIGRQHPLARCHRDGTILDRHATTSVRKFDELARVSLGLEPDGAFI